MRTAGGTRDQFIDKEAEEKRLEAMHGKKLKKKKDDAPVGKSIWGSEIKPVAHTEDSKGEKATAEITVTEKKKSSSKLDKGKKKSPPSGVVSRLTTGFAQRILGEEGGGDQPLSNADEGGDSDPPKSRQIVGKPIKPAPLDESSLKYLKFAQNGNSNIHMYDESLRAYQAFQPSKKS